MNVIELKDFKKLELRVGEIIGVEKIEGHNNVFKIRVDVGRVTQTVSKLKGYSTKDLIGKKVVFLANYQPEKIFGIESQGAILSAKEEKKLVILTVDKEVKNGTLIK